MNEDRYIDKIRNKEILKNKSSILNKADKKERYPHVNFLAHQLYTCLKPSSLSTILGGFPLPPEISTCV